MIRKFKKMACPFAQETRATTTDQQVTYTEYLKLHSLLGSVKPLTDVHDEHLFIITHQTYELWFKQIIHEIDSVREIFLQPKVNEKSMLRVNSRLARIVKILVILSDQIKILETMTPMDFYDFRTNLSTSSGFQSWQFRIIENKLGVRKESRINYNQACYTNVFEDEILKMVNLSEEQPSVFDLVEKWLERTPGKKSESFDFIKEIKISCNKWFEEMQNGFIDETDILTRESLENSLLKTKENFSDILDEDKYNVLRSKGDRRLSWSAFYGALMIYFYRDEVLFHEPFQMINLLMDIDSLIMKWRSNHVQLVQRQIGSKAGTGGSSGYRYLRATVSDRYKAFLDFFNLSNYLIPRSYIPNLNKIDRQRLASVCMINGEDVDK